MVGRDVQFTATPGRGDALAGLLLDVAARVRLGVGLQAD
jgi:hypothetical protein